MSEMTLDANEVQVGTPNGPGIYLAPEGTEAPDIGDDWDDPWELLGYLSEDGPTVGQATTSEALTPWQSTAPIRQVVTGREVTLQFVLWQLNAMTLALYFDTDLPTSTGDDLDMEIRTDQAGHLYAVAIDSRDGDRILRVSFPRASLSDAGDMAITRGSVVPLDCTLSALEDAGVLARVQLGSANGGGLRAAKPSRNGITAPAPSGGPPARRGGGKPAAERPHHTQPGAAETP